MSGSLGSTAPTEITRYPSTVGDGSPAPPSSLAGNLSASFTDGAPSAPESGSIYYVKCYAENHDAQSNIAPPTKRRRIDKYYQFQRPDNAEAPFDAEGYLALLNSMLTSGSMNLSVRSTDVEMTDNDEMPVIEDDVPIEGKEPPKQLIWVRPYLSLPWVVRKAFVAYVEEVQAGGSVKDCDYQLPEEQNFEGERLDEASKDLKNTSGVKSAGYEAAFAHQQEGIQSTPC
jgi:hypothetical protein